MYMSDFEFKPIYDFCEVTNSSINYAKVTNTDKIVLHICNNSPYKITLPLVFLGYNNPIFQISKHTD